MELEHHLTTVLLGEAERMQAPAYWREPLASARATRAGQRGDARTGYVEVRLSETNDGRVDLLTLTSARQRTSLASSLPESDEWSALRTFCVEWSRYGSPLAEVPGLWLEYDNAGAASDAAPSAHFSLVPDAVRVNGKVTPYGTAEWKNVEFAALLLGAEQRHVAEFRARTVGFPMVYVGVMTARAPATLKGYLVMRPNDFERVCLQLGWENAERVHLDFSRLGGRSASHMYVDFTLDAHGVGELAVVFPQQYVLAGEPPNRNELIDNLVEVGYCKPEYAEFLSRWAGQTTWESTRGYGQRVSRWLDLKVTYAGVPGAKAYLGVDTRNLTWIGTD